MKTKLRLVGLTASLAMLASLTTAPSVAAAGICNGFTAPGGHKVFVARDADDAGIPGTVIDYVRGDVTARDLDVCTGTGGGTFVLPANVENAGTGNIYQLGYGQKAGDSSEDFWMAITSAENVIRWPGSMVPIQGKTYRFEIERWKTADNLGHPRFHITRLDTGEHQSYTPSNPYPHWSDGVDLAWWGAEALEAQSDLGSDSLSGGTTILRFLGYSTETSNTVYFRTDMTNANDRHYQPNPFPSNIDNQHGHVTTWNAPSWVNDALQVETH